MPILLSTFAIMIDWNIIFSQIATVAFDIIYFGAIIGTIVVVILDNRNPVKTMAWILVLMFLPIVGLVFYFFSDVASVVNGSLGKKLWTAIEEANGGISGSGFFCFAGSL